MYVIECMQDAGKEDYLRPSERIGLDWIGYARNVCIGGVREFKLKYREQICISFIRRIQTRSILQSILYAI